MESARGTLQKLVVEMLSKVPQEQAPLAAWEFVCGKTVADRTKAMSYQNNVVTVQVPDATWVWRLNRTASGGTRLVTRVRARYTGWSALIGMPLMELGDFPMMRKCLLGIRLRATADSMAR